MYGLSDKCPASVDKLSSLLELILSLDFDSECVLDAVRCEKFHGITQCDVTNLLGGAFNLAVKIAKVMILDFEYKQNKGIIYDILHFM